MKRPFGTTAEAQPVPRGAVEEVSAERSVERDRARIVAYLPYILEGAAVIVAAFAVSVILTWPLITDFGDDIFGVGGDSTGGMASFRQWADEIGYHILGTSHISSAGAPFGFDQGNGVNLQAAFVFFPAYLFTEAFGEIVAYNLVVLSALALPGAAMYWLVRWLGCGWLVAGWAGLVFMVFPWHIEKAQGHPSLAHIEGFPLLLLAVFAWYHKPNLPRALLVAAASAILWTTSGYFGLMGLACLGPLLALAFVFHARAVGIGRALRRAVAPAAASLAVPLVVYAVASRGATEEGIAQARGLSELVLYGARPWEYLIPSYRNPLFGDEVGHWLAAHQHGSNFSETSLYVGWLTIVLAAGWLAWALARRSSLRPELRFATVALAVTVVTGLVFSLPTPLPRTDIPTPVRLIWEVAPQFRVPARFVALVMAGLVPLAALALNGVSLGAFRRVGSRALAVGAAAVVCVVAGVVSFVELSISPPAIVTDLSVEPPEYEAVRKAPPGLLAEYPLAFPGAAINSDYLFWQRVHDRRIVNGARAGTFADSAMQTLVDPTTPGTARALAALGVSVIVVRPSTYAFVSGRPVPPDLGYGYRRLATISTGSTVWQVTAKPAPAVVAFISGFHAPESITPRSTMRWMTGDARVEFFARRAGTHDVTFAALSYVQPRRLRISGAGAARTFDVPVTFKTMTLRLSLPRGRSSLDLSADPGPVSLPDGRQVTFYMTNWGFQRPPKGAVPVPIRAAPAR